MGWWSRRAAHLREGKPVRATLVQQNGPSVYQHGNRAVGVVVQSDEEQRFREAEREAKSRQFEDVADRMKAARLEREKTHPWVPPPGAR